MSDLKIVTLGAWGHLGRVLGELDETAGEFRVAAMASAFAWEQPDSYRQKHPCARGAKVFGDHRAMLDEVRPDVAIISTRPDRIGPLAIEAAERGIHLICEKPLAIEQESLRLLWDTCLARGVRCIAILNNHAHPVIRAARAAVDAGLVGTVALANARKSYKWGARPDWFGHRALYGGTIPWVGIHALDFIYSTTGQWFTSVAAMHSNVAHPDYRECEDNAALAVRLRGGGHASASIDLLRPESADTHGDDQFRVVGELGAIEGNLTRNTCTILTHDRAIEPLPLPADPLRVFVDFIRDLNNGSTSPIAAADMLRAFALTHASLVARDAADTRQVLELPAAPFLPLPDSPVRT